MAVQTPVTNSTFDVVAGNIRMQILKFASVANNDTFTSDLGTIIAFSLDSGNSATTAMTWTNAQNGSPVTFVSGSGPATNGSLVLFGF